MASTSTEATQIWRRIGLDELYREIRQVKEVIKSFERMIESLPRCTKCAQSALLQDVQKAGNELSVQLVGLGMLASALKDAVAASEKVSHGLNQSPPVPCRCSGEPCACHDE